MDRAIDETDEESRALWSTTALCLSFEGSLILYRRSTSYWLVFNHGGSITTAALPPQDRHRHCCQRISPLIFVCLEIRTVRAAYLAELEPFPASSQFIAHFTFLPHRPACRSSLPLTQFAPAPPFRGAKKLTSASRRAIRVLNVLTGGSDKRTTTGHYFYYHSPGQSDQPPPPLMQSWAFSALFL